MAGGRVFDESLNALAPFGRLVAYGIASRQPNEVASGALMRTQPGRRRLLADALPGAPAGDDRRAAARPVRSGCTHGELRIVEGETYRLSEAGRAHEDLQARRTTGKLLLDPSR